MKLGEAAQALGVSEITLRRRVRSGRLPYDFRAGKYFVFVPQALDRNVFLSGPGIDEEPVLVPALEPRKSLSDSTERAAAAANILRPYAREPEDKAQLRISGPTGDQVMAILKTELMEKDREISSLKGSVTRLEAELEQMSAKFLSLQKQIADQSTLLVVLEGAYSEVEAELVQLQSASAGHQSG